MIFFTVSAATIFSWALTLEGVTTAIANTVASFGGGDIPAGGRDHYRAARLAARELRDHHHHRAAAACRWRSSFGINPLHYGIVMAESFGIGVILPPIGIALYVACAICGAKVERAMKPMLWYLLVLLRRPGRRGLCAGAHVVPAESARLQDLTGVFRHKKTAATSTQRWPQARSHKTVNHEGKPTRGEPESEPASAVQLDNDAALDDTRGRGLRARRLAAAARGHACARPDAGAAHPRRCAYRADGARLERMVRRVLRSPSKAKSNGAIQVQIYPNAQMGNERDIGQAVRSGALEVGVIGVGLTNWVPEVSITDAPYLWKTRPQAYRAFAGAFGDELRTRARDKGFVLIGWTDLGFRCITNSKRQINSISDMQGLKMRVPISKAYIAMVQAMGATTAAVDLSELYLALRQGVADGRRRRRPS